MRDQTMQIPRRKSLLGRRCSKLKSLRQEHAKNVPGQGYKCGWSRMRRGGWWWGKIRRQQVAGSGRALYTSGFTLSYTGSHCPSTCQPEWSSQNLNTWVTSWCLSDILAGYKIPGSYILFLRILQACLLCFRALDFNVEEAKVLFSLLASTCLSCPNTWKIHSPQCSFY